IAVVILGNATPRAQVELVHGPRCVLGVGAPAVLHPLAITPLIREIPDDRGGARRLLGEEGIRVGLVHRVSAVARDDVVLVERPGADAVDESGPDAGGVRARFQAMTRGIPAVEFADYGNGGRVGRPDGEMRSARAFRGADGMRTELFIRPDVRAFAEEIDVVIR